MLARDSPCHTHTQKKKIIKLRLNIYLVCVHWLCAEGSLVCVCWTGWAAPGWCSPFWQDTELCFGAMVKQLTAIKWITERNSEGSTSQLEAAVDDNQGTAFLTLSIVSHTIKHKWSRAIEKDDRTVPERWCLSGLAGNTWCGKSCRRGETRREQNRGTTVSKQNWKQKWPFHC